MIGTVTGSTGLGVDAGPLPGGMDPAAFEKLMRAVTLARLEREKKDKAAAAHDMRAMIPAEPAYRPAPAKPEQPVTNALNDGTGGDLYATMGGQGIQSGGAAFMPWSPGMPISAGNPPIYMGNWKNARNVMAAESKEIPSQRDLATAKTGLTDAQRAQIEHDRWVRENKARAEGMPLPPPTAPNGPAPASAQGD